jgi:hypothetical protein
MKPATSIAELGILELGTARLAFAPPNARPSYGAESVPPAEGTRYAYVEDYTVVLYREEQDVAGQLNVEIEQGTTFTYTFKWKQVSGDPVNLTGALAKMQVRAEKSTTADHKVTFASYAAEVGDPTPWFDAIDIDEEDGIVTVYVTPAQTAQVPEGDWWYDLVLTLTASGEVHRLVEGRCVVDPGVTA